MPAKQKRNPEELSVISLFTGVGGLDFGFEAAGFCTRVGVEMDPACCTTIAANRPWVMFQDKIENVASKELLLRGKLKVGEASMLIGGPPCQPFSKSGYWKSGDSLRLNDPRANTLESYMRVLEETLPQAFLLENVYGLAYRGKDEGLEYLEQRIQQINKKRKVKYTFTWKILNSAHFGVPQVRERIFIIGSRDGREFEFPKQTFFEAADRSLFADDRTQVFRTAWDAIGDLDSRKDTALPSKVGGNWGDLLPSIPEGENYLWHTSRSGGKPLFGWRTRYWSFLLKLAKNRPSWTIQAQPGSAIGPFHWKNRRLTMREMARIQTFPDDVNILGGTSKVQMQIGNAVPSLLAEVLAKEIGRQFFGRVRKGAPILLPPCRDPIPLPEEIAAVPRKYKPVPISERALREEKLEGPIAGRALDIT